MLENSSLMVSLAEDAGSHGFAAITLNTNLNITRQHPPLTLQSNTTIVPNSYHAVLDLARGKEGEGMESAG